MKQLRFQSLLIFRDVVLVVGTSIIMCIFFQLSMNGYLYFSDPPDHYTYPLSFPMKDWPTVNDPSFIGIFFSKCRIGSQRPEDPDQRRPGVYFRMDRDLQVFLLINLRTDLEEDVILMTKKSHVLFHRVALSLVQALECFKYFGVIYLFFIFRLVPTNLEWR